MHFPPSKGAQISPFFVPPCEGVRRRHCFESALCPCFSCRRAFPTFRRCAKFPCFRLTFRRCAEASLLREPLYQRFSSHRGIPTFRRCAESPSEGAWSRHIFESALCPCFSCRRAFPTFRRCAEFPCFRPTFRRCVESPHLRERPVSAFFLPPCISHLPKVRRFPSSSSHLPKVRSFKMKRPDVLCRKTSIAITRILVFLPLFNRK